MPFKFNPIYGTLDLVNSSSSGSGNVSGVPPTDIDAIARWDDTTGTTIKNSPGTAVRDSGAIEANGFIGNREVSTVINVPTNYTWVRDSVEMKPGGIIVMNPGSKLIFL